MFKTKVRWYFRNGAVAVDAPTGTPEWIKQMEKIEKCLTDPDYKRVAEDKIGHFWISTVWGGLDINIFGEKIHIFETVVFDTSKKEKFIIPGTKKEYTTIGHGVEADRYSTEDEALEGHQELVEKYKKMTKKGGKKK